MPFAEPDARRCLADKEYRDVYASALMRVGIAAQIRAMRRERGWTQAELGERAGLRQERSSRLEDPDFESLRLDDLEHLASAFDVAIVARFAPFSDVVEWAQHLVFGDLAVSPFADDLS